MQVERLAHQPRFDDVADGELDDARYGNRQDRTQGRDVGTDHDDRQRKQRRDHRAYAGNEVQQKRQHPEHQRELHPQQSQTRADQGAGRQRNGRLGHHVVFDARFDLGPGVRGVAGPSHAPEQQIHDDDQYQHALRHQADDRVRGAEQHAADVRAGERIALRRQARCGENRREPRGQRLDVRLIGVAVGLQLGDRRGNEHAQSAQQHDADHQRRTDCQRARQTKPGDLEFDQRQQAIDDEHGQHERHQDRA